MNSLPLEITSFEHPAWSGQIGLETIDITPPIGIYSRCWGAADHDVAESIHRPLTLNIIVLQPEDTTRPFILVEGDLPWWQTLSMFTDIQNDILQAFDLPVENFWLSVTHTHSAPPLKEVEETVSGGKLHRQWVQRLRQAIHAGIHEAMSNLFAGTIDWAVGECDLAKNRDFSDPDETRILCGFNPKTTADNTLIIGRISDESQDLRGVIVNYACHPTTLAWQNRAISPDFIGAMRQLIKEQTQATPFFLQGASGDLAPRHQYVSDVSVADRHGRQLGYAVLSTLEGMEPAGKALRYKRVKESGAPLAVWKPGRANPNRDFSVIHSSVAIPLKDWPTASELERQRVSCEDRALEERLRRKRDIRRALGDDATYSLPIWGCRMGNTILIGTMAEAYSEFQVELRRRFPDTPIVFMNLLNGSIGYLPPAYQYGLDLYPVAQTPFAKGCFELTLDAAIQLVHELRDKSRTHHSTPLISIP